MDKHLVINRMSDFARGLKVNLRPEGQGLTLKDTGGIARGVIYLPALDSGQRDFRWTRVVTDVTDFEGVARLSACASNTDFMPGESMRVDEYLTDPYTSLHIKTAALDRMYTSFYPQGRDVLLDLQGRYLFLKIELTLMGGTPPVLRGIKARLDGDHMIDYLPAVYEKSDKNGFLYRYLSLFDVMIKDLEENIEHFDERLDFDKQSGELLQYLAEWVDVSDPGASDEELRKLLRTAVTDYERAQTPAGIKKLVQRLTGEAPILIEPFELDEMRTTGKDAELYSQLYGADPNCFFILLPEDCFESSEEQDRFLQRISEELPANVQAQLVLLKRSVYLDRHSYLGVNTMISGRSGASIDRRSAIEYDSVIGGEER